MDSGLAGKSPRPGMTDAGVGVTALAFRYFPNASTRITCRRAELSN
jgi:hypothetical protein